MRSNTLRLLLALTLAALATAALAGEPATFQRIDQALAEGRIDASEAALNKIHYIFDQTQVDERFLVRDGSRTKGATWLFEQIRGDEAVSEDVKAVLQNYIDGSMAGDGDRDIYYSPGGNFYLIYYTTGGSAVPATDDNANGVPDFVEWCAEYLDYSWTMEIDTWGFTAPYIVPGYWYQINFEDMAGAYGYTTIVNASQGRTRIVLHNDFLGFPANDDPEGNQKGAAKVTCAHEFKHASQYMGSRWSEGEWVECDATHMEEAVFPVVNDYHNYVAYTGSPLYNPEQSLDYGGGASYEDCIWHEYLEAIHGIQMLVDLWEWRKTHQGYSMWTSYDTLLGDYGSNVEDAFGGFTSWNDLTGGYSIPGYGYDDASLLYPRRNWKVASGLPSAPDGTTVNHMATRFARHYNMNTLPDYPKVIFDGQDGIDFRPQIIIKKDASTALFFDMTLDANSDGEFIVPVLCSEMMELHLSFANVEWTGYNYTFEYDMTTDPSGGSGAPTLPGWGALHLHANYPNPFNPETTLLFELADDSPVTLEILDAGGRVLRHLLDGRAYEAGEHQLVFDGRDDAGRPLASGVYFARIHVGGPQTQLQKMVLLK